MDLIKDADSKGYLKVNQLAFLHNSHKRYFLQFIHEIVQIQSRVDYRRTIIV